MKDVVFCAKGHLYDPTWTIPAEVFVDYCIDAAELCSMMACSQESRFGEPLLIDACASLPGLFDEGVHCIPAHIARETLWFVRRYYDGLRIPYTEYPSNAELWAEAEALLRSGWSPS